MAPYCESIEDDISSRSEIPCFTSKGTAKTLLDPEDVLVSMDLLRSVVSTISDRCKLENKNNLNILVELFRYSESDSTLMNILTNGTVYGTHYLEEDSETKVVYFAFPTEIVDDGKYKWSCIRALEPQIDELNAPEAQLEYFEDIFARGEEIFGLLADEDIPYQCTYNESFSSSQVVRDFFASAETIVKLSKTPTFESSVPSFKEIADKFYYEEEENFK